MKTKSIIPSRFQMQFPKAHSGVPATGWQAGVLLAVGVAVCCGASPSAAQTTSPTALWEAAYDLEMEGDASSRAGGIAADESGKVFVAGYTKDSAGMSYGIIRSSTNKGTTWTDSDVMPGAQYLRMASRGGETVAAAISGGNCLIRGTTTAEPVWNNILTFTHPDPNYALQNIWDVDLSDSANLYVVVNYQEKVATGVVKSRGVTTTTYSTVARYGMLRRQSGVWSWVPSSDPITKVACAGTDVYCIDNTSWKVRKSVDGGNSWTLLNTYQFENDPYTNATDIAADSGGTLYVTGTGKLIVQVSKRYTAFYHHWIVRKGTPPPAGSTEWTSWETDSLRFGPERAENQATAVTVDRNDQVHVVGKIGVDGLDNLASRWLTREYSPSQVGTWSWTTTDEVDLGSANGYGAHGNRIAADPFGNVYAKGGGYFGDGWIIRRKTAP